MAKKIPYTAEAFAAKMDAFIEMCESEGADATDYRLIQFFGITPAVLEKFRAENRLNVGSKMKSKEIADALKKLELYREDAAIRQVAADPKLTSHCALKLRQPRWGGWNDKGEGAQDLTIRVKLGDGERDLME